MLFFQVGFCCFFSHCTDNFVGVLSQEALRSQAPVQASMQVLQELGDQLKQQVDTSSASAIQSDRLSLTQRLAAVEQALTRQLTTLQVEKILNYY